MLSIIEGQNQIPALRGLLSVREAARYLSVSQVTVRRLAWNGDLRCVRIRRKVLFDIKEIERYVGDNMPGLDMDGQKSYDKPKRETARERGLDG